MKGIPKKFETSYVYNDSISRISLLLTQNENIEKINKKTQLPYLFTDKPKPIQFNYNLAENSSSDISSEISWNINSNEIPTPILYNFKLLSNTIDKTTLLIFQLIIVYPSKIGDNLKNKIINSCNKICIEMINNIDILLQENNSIIFQFESDIINSSKETIWNVLKQINEYLKKKNKIKDFKIDGNWDIGTKLTVIFNEKETFNFIISYISNDKDKKKWEFEFTPIENVLEKVFIRWSIIEISKDKSFICVEHIFKEMPSIEILNELKLKKTKIISIIKNYIEKKK